MFLICTSFVARADKGALVGEDPVCEQIMEATPLSRLIAEIAEKKLDRRVEYQIQVRVNNGDKFEFNHLRSLASRRGVGVDVLNVSTFRGNPVVDFTIEGVGRRVIQTLLDLPPFKSGPYWMTAVAAAPPDEASPSGAVPSVAVGKWYNGAAARANTLRQAVVRAEQGGVAFVVTNYRKPAFVAFSLAYFDKTEVEKLNQEAAALEAPGFDAERFAKMVAAWKSKRLTMYQESDFNGMNGAETLKQITEKRRIISILPQGIEGEDIDRHFVLMPLTLQP